MPSGGVGTAIDITGCGCSGCDGCTSDDDCAADKICDGTNCVSAECECCYHGDNSVGCAQPGWSCYLYAEGWRCVDCNLSAIEACIGMGCGDPGFFPDCQHYDFDGDCDVDFTDLGQFNGACPDA